MKYLFVTLLALLSFSCSQRATTDFTGSWIEVTPYKELIQGITLNADGSAASIGMETLKYDRWKAENGKIILWGKSIGNRQTINFIDTLSVLKSTPDSLVLGKCGMREIAYYKTVDPNLPKPFNVLDSLRRIEGLNTLETRIFEGSLSGELKQDRKCSLTLYNYKNSGNGVFILYQDYANVDESIKSYGRMYTLRGDANNPNAVVYQLVSFTNKVIMNLLYKSDKLIRLDNKFMPFKYEEGNTLLLNPSNK